jgi:hypothetical protein
MFGVVVGALLFLGFIIMLAVLEARLSAKCLRLGYPTARLSVTFQQYCIARVDQTDVVVPLAEAALKTRRAK